VRIVTLNVNGIRSSERRGFARWLARAEPWDIVCLQEIKATHDDIPRSLKAPRSSHAAFLPAERKGYSGVAIYAKRPPRIVAGFGCPEFDAEGRYIEVQIGKLSVVSLYLPSGSSSELRQQVKFEVMDRFMPHLHGLHRTQREYIVCGDWNIAHKEIDLKNWRGNQKNSGFLPEERAWMDQLFGESGFVDAFREVDQREYQYTWWSNRGNAWENNTGWRIDYQVITPGLKPTVKAASIYKDERFSDHAPLIIDYDYKIK